MNSPWARLRGKIVDARPDELRALALAFAFNFVILGSYYVIRPIRDEIGAAGGLESLSWMFTGTLGAMLIANALFSAIVARMSRRRFIPIAYRFFIVNLGLFYLLMRTAPAAQQVWIGRAFLYLGQRFQSVCRDRLLGVHDRHLQQRARQASLRLH
ncbi:MAG TPA: hypothetical protein VGQ82_02815 [Chthoniobacterales bacterium]|nr:hypothetical protein [Chthoniobacterales bacterium]